MEFVVLAYYLFTSIEDPEKEIKAHKKFLNERDIRCRIYISHEGINGQMSASKPAAQEYMEWLKANPAFEHIEFKLQESFEHVFAKATVKTRNQLVALGADVDMSLGGEHVSAEKWAEMLENRDEKTLVLDVRNEYESAIGHFEGSVCPKLETFRQFPQLVEDLKDDYDPEQTTVMMCCTGGIRCEVYSALMREKGFKNVKQLDGGIIRYGEKMGSKHWKGKLFVFDDRLAVPISSEESAETISHCSFCDVKSDTYLNCAHMDCNKLFLACPKCAGEHKGCCGNECMGAKRVRKFNLEERPKPYRKLPFEEKQCI